MNQPWISASNKARLLEYKGRLDLLQYASRGCPKLLFSEIENYIPKKREASDWPSIFERVNLIDDDGHAAKLVRAFAYAQRISRPWENSEKFRVKDGLWLQLGNMGSMTPHLLSFLKRGKMLKVFLAIDSVEGAATRWVRHTGFEQAWEK